MTPHPIKESAIEKPVVKFAKDHGLIAWKLSAPGTRGVPDRMFLGPRVRGCLGKSANDGGHCVFIEFKRPPSAGNPGGKLTALQEKWGRAVQKMGFRWEVVDSVERGCQILREEFCL